VRDPLTGSGWAARVVGVGRCAAPLAAASPCAACRGARAAYVGRGDRPAVQRSSARCGWRPVGWVCRRHTVARGAGLLDTAAAVDSFFAEGVRGVARSLGVGDGPEVRAAALARHRVAQ